MDIKINAIDKVTVVSVVGRLDTSSYVTLEQRVAELLSNQQHQMVIDCSAMDYISSSGLRIFLLILKRIKAANGSLSIAGLQPTVRNIFEISGFLSIFTILESAEQAVQQARK